MSAPNDSHPDHTESLIAEPLSVRLGIDRTKGNTIAPMTKKGGSLTPEADAIETAHRVICRRRENVTFMLHGRPHKLAWAHPANPTKGTAVITRAGGRFGAQIVVAPLDEPALHIYAECHLVENGKFVDGEPRVFLQCEGNPTTMMAGNNVLPISFRDPKSRAIEPYPSSAHSALTRVNRELFFFLDTLARQVTRRKESLFSAETRQAIFRGNFRIVHIQWCCYLQAKPSPFLRILVALFAPPAGTEVGFAKLAEQLGLRFDYERDEHTRVTAVLFEKRHGKNSVWSVGCYNKRTGIGQMRQGKTLEADENELIDNNVRFDMTAHGPAIMEIIGDAVRTVTEYRLQTPEFLESPMTNEFLSSTPEQTARWLEFAVHILSHRLVDGNIRRGSFADYIVPKFSSDVLRLDSIVRCTAGGLREFERLDHPLAKAWRETHGYDTSDWAGKLCEKAGCSMTTFYERRIEWLAKFQVDIAIPCAYYRDLRFYTPASLVLPEGRKFLPCGAPCERWRRDVATGRRADRSFFAQMSEIVGVAISSPPPLLRTKVEGEVKAIAHQPTKAVPAGGPARRLGSPQNALPPPPSRSSGPGPGPSSSTGQPLGGGSPQVASG